MSTRTAIVGSQAFAAFAGAGAASVFSVSSLAIKIAD
jgi:hypothetical protein